MKIGGVSIADHIFADVTDVPGQDNTNACEGMSSISFGLSHAEESRRLRAKSARVGGVLAEHVFSTLFLPCVSRYLFSFVHSAQLTIDSRSRDTAFWAGSSFESTGKSFRVIRMFQSLMLSCVFWVARALR